MASELFFKRTKTYMKIGAIFPVFVTNIVINEKGKSKNLLLFFNYLHVLRIEFRGGTGAASCSGSIQAPTK
jgi:hypothetical protein